MANNISSFASKRKESKIVKLKLPSDVLAQFKKTSPVKADNMNSSASEPMETSLAVAIRLLKGIQHSRIAWLQPGENICNMYLPKVAEYTPDISSTPLSVYVRYCRIKKEARLAWFDEDGVWSEFPQAKWDDEILKLSFVYPLHRARTVKQVRDRLQDVGLLLLIQKNSGCFTFVLNKKIDEKNFDMYREEWKTTESAIPSNKDPAYNKTHQPREDLADGIHLPSTETSVQNHLQDSERDKVNVGLES